MNRPRPQPERTPAPQTRLRQWAQQLERLCDREVPMRSGLGGKLLWLAEQHRALADEIEKGAVVLCSDSARPEPLFPDED